MSISISYDIPASGIGWQLRKDCATASLNELRFYYFLGGVEIRTERSQVSSKSKSGSVIDVATSLLVGCVMLSEHAIFETQYDFKESDESILIARLGDNVEITPSDTDETIIADFVDFARAVGVSYVELIHNLARDYPRLLLNRNLLIFRGVAAGMAEISVPAR